MDIRNRRAIHHAAGQALVSAPGEPKKVVLVYAGVACLLSLASSVVSFMLDHQIADTGGLSNMGLRSMLSTIQYVLPIIQLLVMQCMGLGYHAAALDMSRGKEVSPRTLLEGFRRFGPLIRAAIFMGLMYLALAMGTMYLSVYIFLLLPVSGAFYQVMEPLLSSASVLQSGIVLDDATMAAVSKTMTPMLVIYALVFLVVCAPLYYQYRMVNFCLVDSDHPRAFGAMRDSRAMMRRNRIALFRLDLSLWWYYLLQLLIVTVAYLDLLLPLVGISFPWPDTVSYFLFFVASLVLQLVVYYFTMNRVHVTYAKAYEALRPKSQNNGVALGNIFDM